MDRRTIVIYWDGNDTRVSFTGYYADQEYITKLDNLQDSIAVLQDKYEKEYNSMMKEHEKNVKKPL